MNKVILLVLALIPGIAMSDTKPGQQNQEYIDYVKNAAHVLVDQQRLVCQTERQFRKTMNDIIIDKNPRPRYILTGVCKVTKMEYLVFLDALSKDKKVAEIRFSKYENYAPQTRFTDTRWIVTKKKYYGEIVKSRNSAKY